MRLGAPRIRRASLRWLVIATAPWPWWSRRARRRDDPEPGRVAGRVRAGVRRSVRGRPASTPPTGEATRAETVVVKAFRKPDALIGNHYIASSDALISDGIHQLVNEPLFFFDYATGDVVPWTAESYEYNADNTEITINIRDGVTWQDGEPFTADDIVFTLDQIVAAEAPYRAANIKASVESADGGRSADREDHAQRAEPAVRPDGPVRLHLHGQLHPGPEAHLRRPGLRDLPVLRPRRRTAVRHRPVQAVAASATTAPS